mmetsp:Transcript_7664/g.16734  ORF Transcript_7664/g.16734 Transcript_7664/m.16734 type:complete len:236 (+) Transcript_7664:1163-1870(+)
MLGQRLRSGVLLAHLEGERLCLCMPLLDLLVELILYLAALLLLSLHLLHYALHLAVTQLAELKEFALRGIHSGQAHRVRSLCLNFARLHLDLQLRLQTGGLALQHAHLVRLGAQRVIQRPLLPLQLVQVPTLRSQSLPVLLELQLGSSSLAPQSLRLLLVRALAIRQPDPQLLELALIGREGLGGGNELLALLSELGVRGSLGRPDSRQIRAASLYLRRRLAVLRQLHTGSQPHR